MATRLFQGTDLENSEYIGGIEGVRVTISTDAVFNNAAFVSLGMNTDPVTGNAMWGQVGMIREVDGKGDYYLAPFYQVWDGGSLLVDKTDFRQKLALGEDHTFEFSLLRDTKWAFYADGKKIGTYDMRDAEVDETSNGSSFVGTEYSFAITSPITFSNYSVKVDGQWDVVDDAFWFQSGPLDPQNPPAGAIGNLQDPTLPDGTWMIGADLPTLEEGTQLWSSADDALVFYHPPWDLYL